MAVAILIPLEVEVVTAEYAGETLALPSTLYILKWLKKSVPNLIQVQAITYSQTEILYRYCPAAVTRQTPKGF
jgi:hypothetical protein